MHTALIFHAVLLNTSAAAFMKYTVLGRINSKYHVSARYSVLPSNVSFDKSIHILSLCIQRQSQISEHVGFMLNAHI